MTGAARNPESVSCAAYVKRPCSASLCICERWFKKILFCSSVAIGRFCAVFAPAAADLMHVENVWQGFLLGFFSPAHVILRYSFEVLRFPAIAPVSTAQHSWSYLPFSFRGAVVVCMGRP